jgi:hypothetical protein
MGLREHHSAVVFVRARQVDTPDEVSQEAADWDPFAKMAFSHQTRQEEKGLCALLFCLR